MKVFKDRGVMAKIDWAKPQVFPMEPVCWTLGCQRPFGCQGHLFCSISATKTDEMFVEFKKMFPAAVKVKNI